MNFEDEWLRRVLLVPEPTMLSTDTNTATFWVAVVAVALLLGLYAWANRELL